MKRSTMRWLATAASLLGMALGGAAHAQKKLVVYTANESTLNDLVFGSFKKETGIEVEPVAAGSGVLVRRLQAEKARPLTSDSTLSTFLNHKKRNGLGGVPPYAFAFSPASARCGWRLGSGVHADRILDRGRRDRLDAQRRQ